MKAAAFLALGFAVGPVSAAPALAGGFGGNRNYIVSNHCRPLVDASVQYIASSDIRANGNWDMQVNVYSASGVSAYTQFVMAVTTAGEVQWSIEGWRARGPNIYNTCSRPLVKLPKSYLPAHYDLAVSFENDSSSGKITAATFSVYRKDASSGVVAQRRVVLGPGMPICNPSNFKWSNSYSFTPVAMEVNIAGYNNGSRVTFSSAQAVLAYYGRTGISYSTGIPSCTEVKSETVESSNEIYGTPYGSNQGLWVYQTCHL